MLTSLCIMAAGISKINESVQANIGNGKDMTSPATVSTVGPTKFLVFFVTKRDAPCPTVSCGDVDKGFVNKFHNARIAGTLESGAAARKLVSIKSGRGPARARHGTYKRKTLRLAQGFVRVTDGLRQRSR